mgnify:CR=1 FL=1
MKTKRLYVVNIETMLDWYFTDPDDYQRLGREVVEQMSTGEEYKATWRIVWDSLGYTPTRLIENWHQTKWKDQDGELEEIWSKEDWNNAEFKFMLNSDSKELIEY